MKSKSNKHVVNPNSVREFHAATVARIKESKLEAENRRIIEEEERRKETNAFRTKWRDKVKQRRNEEIVAHVDKLLIRETIPSLQGDLRKSKRHINFLQEKAQNEMYLQTLVSGLDGQDAHEYFTSNRDAGNYTLSIGPDKIHAVEFSPRASNKRASTQYIQKIAAFGLRVEERFNKTKESISVLSREPSIDKLTLAQSASSSHLLNSKDRFGVRQVGIDSQLFGLVQDLVSDDSPPHKISGLMEGLMHHIIDPSRLVERTLERRNTLTSEVFAQMQSNMLAKLPATETDEHCGVCSLCDGYYLIGPSRSDMQDGMKQNLGDSGTISELQRRTSMSFRAKSFAAEPRVLSSSFHNELPPEMIELLPAYCYPSGVQVKVCDGILPSQTVKKPESPSVPPPADGSVDKAKRKTRVFFPSDYSMKAAAANVGVNTSNTATATSNTDPTPRSTSKTVFVIKLGDHTYQYYCICILQPVTLHDEDVGADFETSYCICLLTKLPMIALVANIVESMEVVTITTPVEVANDPLFPHPAVKFFEELVAKMKRSSIPTFPFVMKASAVTTTLVDGAAGNDPLHNNNTSNTLNAPSDLVAFLPDIKLSEVVKGEPVSYKRSFFQRYFSSLPASYDQVSEEELMKICHQIGKNKFVAGSIHRSERESEESFHMLLWSLPVLINHLLLDQIVLALGCAMMEMKIIVCHKDPNVVSSIVLALIHLLRPLKWCSPLIISLPDALTDFIDSPVPIIVGLRQLPPNFELQERCVLIDPDVKKIHFHPKDLIENQSIILPNGSRLAHVLKSLANSIRAISRKKRLEKQKIAKLKKMVAKNDVNSASSAAAAIALEKAGEKLLSYENDASSDDCAQLCGAISQFSLIVSNHILALVNTAIHFQAEERKVARAKRRIVKQNSAPVHTDSNPERRKSQRVVLSPSVLRAHANEDAFPDNSLLDDSVSEITYTDMSRSSQRPKGHSGSGTEPDSSASVNSATSSLPSVMTGAPIMAIKDLRPYEQTFINKLTETQMYSNYCQTKKSESPIATVADVNISALTQNESQMHLLDTSRLLNSSVEAATAPLSHALRTPEPQRSCDAVFELFYIMLNGVTPVDRDTLVTYQQEYQRIYADQLDFTASDCEHTLTETEKNPMRKVGRNILRLQSLLNEQLQAMASAELSKIHIDADELRFCCGLLCNGFCNTDSCDSICLALWQKKIAILRKKQAAFQIVSNKFQASAAAQSAAANHSSVSTDSLKLSSPTAVNPWSSASNSESNTTLKYLSPQGFRLEAFKHGKETKSQYQLRQKVISSQIQKMTSDEETLDDSRCPRSKKTGKKKVTIRTYAQDSSGDNTPGHIRQKTFSDSSNVYVTSLAKYYAKKEERYLLRLRKKCRNRINRFLCRYIACFRRRRRLHSVLIIQCMFRGYRVRKQIPILVAELYALISGRLIERCLATIRIRNHIRRNAEAILNAFERKKISRRLATMNIPVRNGIAFQGKEGESPATSNAVGRPPGEQRRSLTATERYISDSAPSLMPKQQPQHAIANSSDHNSARSSSTVASTPPLHKPPASSSAHNTSLGSTTGTGSNTGRPPLVHQSASLSSVPPIDSTAKGEALPNNGHKRSSSGGLSAAAYDFMMHGIKRRSKQDSFKHPFANRRFTLSATSSQSSMTSSNPPSQQSSPTNQTQPQGSGPFQSQQLSSAGADFADAGANSNTSARANHTLPRSPTALSGSAQTSSSNATSVQAHEPSLHAAGVAELLQSSPATSPTASSAGSAHGDTSSSQMPPTTSEHARNDSNNNNSNLNDIASPDFSPDAFNHHTHNLVSPLNATSNHLSDLSPIPRLHSMSPKLSINTDANLLLSPTASLHPSAAPQNPLLSPSPVNPVNPHAHTPTLHRLDSDPIFSPNSFPIVPATYDDSDDEDESRSNRMLSIERKMKLNMLEKSKSKDFVVDNNAQNSHLHTRSNDDVKASSDSELLSNHHSNSNSNSNSSRPSSEGIAHPSTAAAASISSHLRLQLSTSSGSTPRYYQSSPMLTTDYHASIAHSADPNALSNNNTNANSTSIFTPRSTHRSPTERRNVTPIGRYTQSQHMVIPITATNNTSPRYPAGAPSASTSAQKPTATLTEAALHSNSLYLQQQQIQQQMQQQQQITPPPMLGTIREVSMETSMGSPPQRPQMLMQQSRSMNDVERLKYTYSADSNASSNDSNSIQNLPVRPHGLHAVHGKAPPPPSDRLDTTANSNATVITATGQPQTSSNTNTNTNAVLTPPPPQAPPQAPPVVGASRLSLSPMKSSPPLYDPNTYTTYSTSSPAPPSFDPFLTPVNPVDPPNPIDPLQSLSPSASFRFNASDFFNDLNDEDNLNYAFNFNDEDAAQQEERALPPFVTLGATLFDVYSRQQRDAIYELWLRLCAGIEVKKHSRNSKPKVKVLFCDRAMTRITWRAPSSATSSKPFFSRRPASLLAESEDVDEEAPLTNAQTNARRGSHMRYSILSKASHSQAADSDRVVDFRDILEVRSDASSDVLRRSEAKGYLQYSYPTISLITARRTLDFEISEEQAYNEVLQGVMLIRNYYQKYLRDEQQQQQQQKTEEEAGGVQGSGHSPLPSSHAVSRHNQELTPLTPLGGAGGAAGLWRQKETSS